MASTETTTHEESKHFSEPPVLESLVKADQLKDFAISANLAVPDPLLEKLADLKAGRSLSDMDLQAEADKILRDLTVRRILPRFLAGVARRMSSTVIDEYGEVLTPQEIESFFGKEEVASPGLPIDR